MLRPFGYSPQPLKLCLQSVQRSRDLIELRFYLIQFLSNANAFARGALAVLLLLRLWLSYGRSMVWRRSMPAEASCLNWIKPDALVEHQLWSGVGAATS